MEMNYGRKILVLNRNAVLLRSEKQLESDRNEMHRWNKISEIEIYWQSHEAMAINRHAHTHAHKVHKRTNWEAGKELKSIPEGEADLRGNDEQQCLFCSYE